LNNQRKKLDEQQLVNALQNREKSAFEALYDQYSPILYGKIFSIVKSEAVAQDVLQEVMLKIWAKIKTYDAQKASLMTWMMRIARNKAIDIYRSSAYQNSLKQTNLNSPNADASVEMNTDTIGIQELLQKIGEDYRQVIQLAYLEGHTQAEIAKKLNLPLGTVKSRVRIGLRELRKLAKA
jgi:RNA polymerase sigma factor (sigma-70 family)